MGKNMLRPPYIKAAVTRRAAQRPVVENIVLAAVMSHYAARQGKYSSGL
jgi:hypothetical protein